MQADFAVVVLARQAQVAGKGAFVVYCGLAVAVASGLPGDGTVAGERSLGTAMSWLALSTRYS